VGPLSDSARRFSTLGRPVDRRYATNRAIASSSLLAAVLGFAIRRLAGLPSPEAFVGGVTLALAFFLAWAVARELDPDHDLSAFIAAGLSVIPHSILGRPDLAAVLLVLLMLRIVNRTVGPAAKPLDTIAILTLVGVAAWRGHLVLALAAAVAFALDAILNPAHRIHLVAAGASIGMLGVGLSRFQASALHPFTMTIGVALAATLPFLVLIRASGEPRTVSDSGALPLSGRRVRVAQWLGLGALACAIWIEGQAGLESLSPLWAALVGTGFYFSMGAPTRLPHSVHDPS
jgi:hypothetical protein